MQLTTTFRGLTRAESASASSNLERSMARFERLLARPTTVRAVVEGAPPEHRVALSMLVDREDLHAQCTSHDLHGAISTACDRLRNQLVRRRRRRSSNRPRTSPSTL